MFAPDTWPQVPGATPALCQGLHTGLGRVGPDGFLGATPQFWDLRPVFGLRVRSREVTDWRITHAECLRRSRDWKTPRLTTPGPRLVASLPALRVAPPGGGVRVSFPHPAHPQRPEVLRWIRSPVALDPGCCLALWLGGRAVPAAPRSAPPPSPRVLTSDWLLDTPCRQSAQTPGKTKLYQAYPTRPAPGLPRKLRTEILRLGF